MTRGVRARRRGVVGAALAVALGAAAALTLAAPGDLDPGFGADGRVSTDFGGSDEGLDVLVQPDGKV